MIGGIDYDIKDGKLQISPEVLTVSALNEIWEYDTSKAKSKANNMLTYLFTMYDMREKNPFRDVKDSDKEQVCKQNAFGDKKFKFNEREVELIENGASWYKFLNKNSMLRLSAAIDKKIDQVTDFLEDPGNTIEGDIDLKATVEVLGKIDKLIVAKQKTDKFVREEVDKKRNKGGSSDSPLEAGFFD